ncbi:hypothetical protein [Paenibacillus camelliae]|uniref:hypothetical protein n=1 Tax=Paenibacillus camelliae TaxID=512410 RepID=UPI00203F13B7|nr:hypothetical protein [Paenibacillus camelliae]MCM3632922.1 hypothetical protein [Paenibacillus camelliae]
MYLLKGNWEGEKLVTSIMYNMDAPENAELDTSDGVLIDEQPAFPEAQIGKGHILCANADGEVWFEEIDVPLTPEQEMQVRIDQQQALIDMLILDSLGGAE